MPKLLDSLFEPADRDPENTDNQKPTATEADQTAPELVDEIPAVELAETESSAAAPKKSAKPGRARKQKPPKPATGPRPTTWTYGSVVRSKLVTAGVWCALGAGVIGFVAAAGQTLSPTDTVAEKVVAKTDSDPALAIASGFATQYAAAYVSASQSDSSALSLFTDPGSLALPQTAAKVDAVAAAGVTKTKDGIYQVTVAVTAEAPPASTATQSGETGQANPMKPAARVLRYLSVPVAVQSGVAAPAGLPGYVAAPTGRTVQLSGFNAQVTLTSGLGETVAGFLQAYLAGSTDVSRFEDPTVAIPPVTPAVASTVRVTSLAASDTVPDAPADGDTAHVQVVASLQQDSAPAGSVSYVLDLKARAGRWEVTAVNSQTNTNNTSTSTPAPTPTSTTEGKKQ